LNRRLTFWENCALIPPVLVRLLAKKSHSLPLSDHEISVVSGIPEDRVLMIQHMTNWSNINVVEARQFQIGCGINFCNGNQMDRVKSYLFRTGTKQPKWKYLRTSADWRTKYEPLLRRYLKSLSQT
jgi:hypothetical protein